MTPIFYSSKSKRYKQDAACSVTWDTCEGGVLGFLVFDFKEKFVNSSVELVNSCPWRFCCCDELGSVEKGWV